MVQIGNNISEICKQKNISFYRVAKNSKVSESYLNDIVHGKKNNPSINLLKRIANTLQVPIEKLIN